MQITRGKGLKPLASCYLAATDTGDITGVGFKGSVEGIITTQTIF
jgi:hypothetical protein